MKSNHTYYCLLILCFTFTLGCNDDSENDSNNVFKSSIMQAKINGQLKTCKSAFLLPLPNPYNNPYNGISGSTQDDTFSTVFRLNFPISNGVGTYEFGGSNNDNKASVWYLYDLFSSKNRTFNAIKGSVNITSASENKYKGTFSFSADEFNTSNTLNVTEGIFEIDY